ncbi:MAG: hypothetical protein ACOYVG_06315 [Bacteroidota bacterium]
MSLQPCRWWWWWHWWFWSATRFATGIIESRNGGGMGLFAVAMILSGMGWVEA